MDLVGKTIEKYHILLELGRGGMGIVYKAHDTKLDRFVVLKMMHANLAQQFINRFWMEGRSQAMMTHPNIVQIHDFLKTDLGKCYNTKWRFYAYQGDGFLEYDQITEIKSGIGYWLIIADRGKKLDTGTGKTMSLTTPFSVDLLAGWSLIGNPFTFAVSQTQLSLADNGVLDIRTYLGNWSAFTGTLQPFTGYAIYVNQATTLNIDLQKSTALAKDDIDKSKPAINIRASCQNALDFDNYIRFNENAAAGYDAMDRPEPPVIGEYVTVFSPHPDWNQPAKHFCHDVRPKSGKGEIWEMVVKTNIQDVVHLEFTGLTEFSADYEISLNDPAAGVCQDLRERATLQVAGAYAKDGKRLQILVGDHAFIESEKQKYAIIPETHKLGQNYPNPFNSSTTIYYALAREEKVAIRIFNLQGEEVRTLVKGVVNSAGSHVIVWDGRNQNQQPVCSGIYLCTLECVNLTLNRKLVLTK